MKYVICALALAVFSLTACTEEQPPASSNGEPPAARTPETSPTQTQAAGEQPQVRFVEGVHYERIVPPQPIDADNSKVDVIEVFWYGCPHCYDFEPYISEWRQNPPNGAEFVLLPATLNPSWALHARAFFALQQLGETDNLHSKLFQAIHAQGRNLNDLDSVARFVSQYGVDEQAFRKAFASQEVDAQMARADRLARGWRITGVPSVIVDGRYRISASTAGGYDKMIEVIDYLVERESKG